MLNAHVHVFPLLKSFLSKPIPAGLSRLLSSTVLARSFSVCRPKSGRGIFPVPESKSRLLNHPHLIYHSKFEQKKMPTAKSHFVDQPQQMTIINKALQSVKNIRRDGKHMPETDGLI